MKQQDFNMHFKADDIKLIADAEEEMRKLSTDERGELSAVARRLLTTAYVGGEGFSRGSLTLALAEGASGAIFGAAVQGVAGKSFQWIYGTHPTWD